MIKQLREEALDYLSGKNILITGGTGSLGNALLYTLDAENWYGDVTIFSRDENKQGKVKAKYPNWRYVLGDVADKDALFRAMRDVDVVFHFAAYKQVPSAQNNVIATVRTNIEGSQNVVDCAIERGVEHVVASSTDKACAPVNLYGASKSVMESMFQYGNNLSHEDTIFTLARYGNVVCSNGSVIPLFQRQIKEKGEVTITHPDMTRFWISIDQAVDLILSALVVDPGVIVVPKAQAMAITRVADVLYGGEIPKRYTGIRPGEKIHEAMIHESESFHTKEKFDHFLVYPPTEGAFNDIPFMYTSDACGEMLPETLLRMVDDYDIRFK